MISRAEAENLLTQPFNDHGSYLVRNSKNTSSGYALSVRNKGKVMHYIIHIKDNGRFFVHRNNTFQTISKLVWYYKTHKAFDLCLNLKAPCKIQTTSILRETNEDWEIERETICLLVKLNVGQFAEVWIGKWNETTEVAIKVCKPDAIAANKFHDEISFMKKLKHPNILQLYAVCTKKDPIYIITDLMKHGNLLEYLKNDGGLSLKYPELVDIAEQVASGMSYLEMNSYVHRNLSAKSILVSEKLICKVANFSLARATDKGVFVGTIDEQLAIKWTAPEALMYRHFTSKSDVWSFSILLYELLTYGRIPYHHESDAQVLEKLQRGYRMPRPWRCPDSLYDVLIHCWIYDANSRPTFETVQNKLKDCLILDEQHEDHMEYDFAV